MQLKVFLKLVLLSGVITVFTYWFGIIPIKLPILKKYLLKRRNNNFSQLNFDIDTWLEKFTILCNGILIGVALLIVIPEGIETFIEYLSTNDSKDVNISMICLSILVGFAAMHVIDNNQLLLQAANDSDIDSPLAEDSEDKDPNTLIQDIIIDFASDSTNFASLNYQQTTNNENIDDVLSSQQSGFFSFLNFTPTFIWPLFCKVIRYETILIGVLFHSLADGIAFGSSFLSENSSFQIAMILAIVIHKFPTSFSIGCILFNKYSRLISNPDSLSFSATIPEFQHQSKIKYTIDQLVKFEMWIFAICLPLAAILTFSLVHLIIPNIELFAAILLLFSGGTFLYVAVHVINGDDSSHQHHSSNNGAFAVPGRSKIILNVVGMFVPLFFSLIKE